MTAKNTIFDVTSKPAILATAWTHAGWIAPPSAMTSRASHIHTYFSLILRWRSRWMSTAPMHTTMTRVKMR